MAIFIDTIALFLIGALMFIGYKRGLVRSIVDLVTSLLCIPISVIIAKAAASDNPFSPIVWFVAMFFVLKITFSLIGLSLGIVKKLPIIKTVNAIGGSLFGLMNGIVLTTFVCYGMLIISSLSNNKLSNSIFDDSYVCRFLIILISKI